MKAWIARDRDGRLYIHSHKPYLVNKQFEFPFWHNEDENWLRCRDTDFPEVTFENSPVEVEIIEKSTLDEVYKGLDRYENFLGLVSTMRRLQKEQMTADIDWDNLEYYKEQDRKMFELQEMVDKWLEGEAL